MGIWMTINIGVVIVNVILLSGLMWLYGGMFKQAATRFTMGLFGFAFVLWLQNVVQLVFYATMMQYYVDGVQPLVLILNALAMVATLSLLSVTMAPAGRATDA